MAAKKQASKKVPVDPSAHPSRKVRARKVRVRTYRQGLGDCHLISFTKPDGTFFNVLIDCGVVDVTPDPIPLMTGVVQDVAREIRRPGAARDTLDLVIATHQHTDHLSGFRQAQAEFDKLTIKRLWLAWTEDKTNPKGQKLKQQLVNALTAVRNAHARLAPIDPAAADRIKGVLDFFGPVSAAGDETQVILDYLQARQDAEVTYYKPGVVFLLPEVPNVRVYILGPPEDPEKLKIINPRKSRQEGYEETLAADAGGFVDALLPDLDADALERGQPFDKVFRTPIDAARHTDFFKDHYGFTDPDKGESWRRIDTAWLEMAGKLALALDNYTNNSSLALAFEFVDTREVLLFPGDAQIGSWLTWHDLSWKVKAAGGADADVNIRDLFARTVFYKGSHHASHNGTLNQLGLELMNHRGLVVVVPVDKAMSIKKHWDRTLPWQPLLDRLQEKARGRLVLTDRNVPPPVAATLTDLTVTEQKRFAEQVKVMPHCVDYFL